MRSSMTYPWPGNVRELENAIERAVVLGQGEHVDAEHLPGGSGQAASDLPLLVPGVTLAELERLAILQTLEAVQGSTAKRRGAARHQPP